MDKYKRIKVIFEQNSDSEKAAAMAKYMRDLFEFYGIPTPLRRRLARDLIKEDLKGRDIDWEFLDKCYMDSHRELQYLVCDYLSAFGGVLTYEHIPMVKKYIKIKPWWDTVDSFDMIVGNIGLTDPRVDRLMLDWSTDEDFWLRRIAIDHQLCRKEKTNTRLLEEIIVNNLGSREFFINKAIGWSLRDYSKTSPEWVRSFIGKYSDRMDKLSIREASRYL